MLKHHEPTSLPSAAARLPGVNGEPRSGESRLTLSIPAAVEASGLSRSFLYRAMTRGELAFIKKGRRRLIPTTALADYLQRSDGNEARPGGSAR
ncbi:MAG TPA: helix-turn-helix domain-containing protein [Gemmatimonadaceae bacterium]|nr:helix-turn-helix domain-containing protein [Gemmatimonadaceae bacterium]